MVISRPTRLKAQGGATDPEARPLAAADRTGVGGWWVPSPHDRNPFVDSSLHPFHVRICPCASPSTMGLLAGAALTPLLARTGSPTPRQCRHRLRRPQERSFTSSNHLQASRCRAGRCTVPMHDTGDATSVSPSRSLALGRSQSAKNRSMSAGCPLSKQWFRSSRPVPDSPPTRSASIKRPRSCVVNPNLPNSITEDHPTAMEQGSWCGSSSRDGASTHLPTRGLRAVRNEANSMDWAA